MKDRPILFSGATIRALLAGAKTQTRRIVKPQPVLADDGSWRWDGKLKGFVGASGTHADGFKSCASFYCPYGKPGDLLWVREAHYIIGEHAGRVPGSKWTHYAADLSNNLDDTDHQWTRGWKPSIHMPRTSSRLTLRITDVRAERLQDISEADARAEGVTPLFGGMPAHADDDRPTHYTAFARLWQSINGPDSWDANPWVWAISFEVIKSNVDEVIRRTA